MAVRGLVIRPARTHQHPGTAQDVEQRIAPCLDPRFAQRQAQHMMQLARTQSRLPDPQRCHHRHHLACLLLTLSLPVPALVVRLAAVAHVTASPCHAQPLDELLREDLPEGFFTTRTP